MSYPGNPSLAGAVKDRVVSTFQQTLALYHQGRTDEVVAGCNLLLQMDPAFDPAKKLLDKTRNPMLPIDVDSLMPRGGGEDPMAQARSAMASRDFQRVLHLTSDVLSNDMMNDEARILGDEAREKLEAAPFIDQFIRRCDQALAAGNLSAARSDIEKARALDATHPEVIRVSKAIAQRESAPSAPPATPSFVVDDRASSSQATGRAAAPASDFGFTFEEDKPAANDAFSNFSFDAPQQSVSDSPFANLSFGGPAPAAGGFSFDTPSSSPAAPPPPAAPSNEFDFATASVSTSPDDQKKIEQYLSDGDRAFDAGDYQQAIDLWSRIFLIDVTNDQASDRIERAKARRREIESKTETLLGSAITAFDRRDLNRARTELQQVLQLDPSNVTALEYMERLSEPAPSMTHDFVPPQLDDKLDIGFFEEEMPAGSEAPLIPPDPDELEEPAPAKTAGKAKTATKPSKAVKPAGPPRKLPVGLIAAVLAVVLLAGGGYFFWTKFMSAPVENPAATTGIFSRAASLAAKGQYDKAIALLQDIKPSDPQHDKALEMIADLQQKKRKEGETIGGMPPDQYFAVNVQKAKEAFAAHDYLGAKSAFDEARKVKPLTAEDQAMYASAADKVSKLDQAKALFTERKYTDALASLQGLQAEDPNNVNIQRMISDAHFNLGATALQEEKIPDAVREFDEVLKTNPNDELAKRSRELALRYADEPKDLLYRIYVKYLPLRTGA